MRRFLIVLLAALGLSMLAIPQAFAGSPHFVDDTVHATTSGSTLTVAGKEAGLGDEQQVHIVVTADALCINGGGNHPKAVNKTSASANNTFPVQNGKADFSLTLTAVFQPPCSPPMTVRWTNIVVTDTTNNITKKL